MARLQVERYDSLVRDTSSKAVITTATSEYKIYMAQHRARNKQSDELRTACKEINNLKAELREIKELIKGIAK